MTQPYYRNYSGLRFECTRCGNCCTRPGVVYFPGQDLERAAEEVGLSPAAFRRKYRLADIDGIPALDPGPNPCPFYAEEQGCTIYAGRPTQCRTWPFWPEVVRRRASWEKAGVECEGIGRGPRVPLREIETSIMDCEQAGLPEADPW